VPVSFSFRALQYRFTPIVRFDSARFEAPSLLVVSFSRSLEMASGVHDHGDVRRHKCILAFKDFRRSRMLRTTHWLPLQDSRTTDESQ
jgi:hypothetical protein